MATIISDSEDAGFNCYASVADADEHAEALPLADALAWTDLSDDVKTRSLLTATRKIDRHFRFIGQRVDVDQNLAWPRTAISIEGHEVNDEILPAAITEACIEWARLIGQEMVNQTSDLNELAQTVGRVKVGSLELNFKNSKPVDDEVPLSIIRILDRYGRLEAANGLAQGRIIRVR